MKGCKNKADKERGGETTSGNGQTGADKSQRAVEKKEEKEVTDCKVICGVPTTLIVKGLMMRGGERVGAQ